MNRAEAAEADAIASEILTPRMREKIRESITAMQGGHDPELVLSVLCAFAYMDGMVSMAKVGYPQ